MDKIKADIETDKKRRFLRKNELVQNAHNNMNDYLTQKKQFEEYMQNEKLNEHKYKGSLDINHEERLNKLKNYMNLLSEKVDINMNKYVIYNNLLSDKISSGRNSKNNSKNTSPVLNYNILSNKYDNNNEKIGAGNIYFSHNQAVPDSKNNINKNPSFENINNKFFDALNHNSKNYFKNKNDKFILYSLFNI